MIDGRTLASLAALTLEVGCGEPDPLPSPVPPPAPVFAEVCGAAQPQRLLALPAGEHAYRIEPIQPADPTADEGRVLVSTFVVDPTLPLSSLPPTLDLVIHAVGPCGEDPVEVARGLSLTGRYDGLVLACADGGHGAYVVDPEGRAPPRPILEGWCPLRMTEQGLLTVEGTPDARHGTLVLLRDPGDPVAQPQVLAEGIRTARNAYFGPGGNGSTSLWASGSQALVLDEAGNVHRLQLSADIEPDVGEPDVIEQTGVLEMRVSADARWIVWQAAEPTEGDPLTPVGPVFLRDRDGQTDVHLLNTHLEWTATPYAGDYVIVRDDVEGLRVFVRQTGEAIVLPEGTEVRGVLDGPALWLVRRVDDEGTLEELRWSPGEAAPTVLVQHQGSIGRRGDGFEIFDADAVDHPAEGSLSTVPLSGGTPTVVADHVHAGRRWLADGRILTIVLEDETGHGPLRLIDPQTGGWVQLDPRGWVQAPRLAASDPFDGDIVFAIDDAQDVAEDVAEAEAGRRGVYRARVPP